MPVAILGALISAAAAAASGIAGAAGAKNASDAQAGMSAAQRATQEKIAKMQLAQQAQQFGQTQQMAGRQAVGSAYQNQADTMVNRGAERQQSRAGLISALQGLMA